MYLHPHAEAVNSQTHVAAQPLRVKRAGVGLNGHLSAGSQPEPTVQRRQDLLQQRQRQQGGRACGAGGRGKGNGLLTGFGTPPTLEGCVRTIHTCSLPPHALPSAPPPKNTEVRGATLSRALASTSWSTQSTYRRMLSCCTNGSMLLLLYKHNARSAGELERL